MLVLVHIRECVCLNGKIENVCVAFGLDWVKSKKKYQQFRDWITDKWREKKRFENENENECSCWRHCHAKRYACMLREWLTVQSSQFCMFKPLLCVDAVTVAATVAAAVIVVVFVAYSQTITFTHQPHMLCVRPCIQSLNAMQLPTLYICLFQFHMEYFSVRFCCGRHRHHCRSLVLVLVFCFRFIWFHFSLLLLLSFSWFWCVHRTRTCLVFIPPHFWQVTMRL